MLDYSTVIIADKFGSVSVIRLPAETNENTQVHMRDNMHEATIIVSNNS